MKNIIKKIINLKDLEIEEMEYIMNGILNKKYDEILIASFLTALEMKGVKKNEIIGGVKALKKNMKKIDFEIDEVVIDTCGTGGDGKNTVNISTASSIITSSLGIKILKHGNRSVSSSSGSIDVLEKLGIRVFENEIDLKKQFKNNGIAFLYAPLFHPTLKEVAYVRKTLGFKTIFNLLGPLVNPVNVKHQVIGVNNEKLTEVYCEVLKYFGVKRAMVVYGLDGMDEITINTHTKISELNNGEIKTYFLDPKDFGIYKVNEEDLRGFSSEENAEKIYKVLEGEKNSLRDLLLINSAAQVYIADYVKDMKSAFMLLEEAINSKDVLKKYENIKSLSYK